MFWFAHDRLSPLAAIVFAFLFHFSIVYMNFESLRTWKIVLVERRPRRNYAVHNNRTAETIKLMNLRACVCVAISKFVWIVVAGHIFTV